LSIAPVLFISYNGQPTTFYLTSAGFGLFVVALVVTMLVEVHIVKHIVTCTVSTLRGNWQQLRSSPLRQWDHKLVRRVRLRKARDLGIHQPRLSARL
jgi:hypothetical protein